LRFARRNGNRHCPAHGWKPKGLETGPRPAKIETCEKQELSNELEKPPMNEEPRKSKIDSQKVKKALVETFSLLKRAGGGAIELLRRLKKDKSPAAMLKNVEDASAANKQRREGVSAHVDQLHRDIVAKKGQFAKASPMQKRILEKELGALVASYEAAERELTVLLENEKVLSQVKGRLMEVSAYGLAGVEEGRIDELIDEVEEAVARRGRTVHCRSLRKSRPRRAERKRPRQPGGQAAMFGDEEPAASEAAAELPEQPDPESRKPEAAPPEN
jgi:hypothetical protein